MRLRKAKQFVSMMVWVLLSLGHATMAQSDIINDVKQALKSGSAKEVAKLMNANVGLSLDGKNENYSKAQAEFVLKNFFKEHPPTSFIVVHQGASKGKLPYAIGQYVSNGDSFRIWIRIKNSEGRFRIHEMSFTPE